MIEFITYRRRLVALQKERQALISEMEPPQLGVEYDPSDNGYKRVRIVEHKMFRLMSDYYYEIAFKYGINIPSDSECWEASEAYPGTDHLTSKGLSFIRDSIHKERKRKAEFFSIWVAGLTGLIGAITGLVAVLAK